MPKHPAEGNMGLRDALIIGKTGKFFSLERVSRREDRRVSLNVSQLPEGGDLVAIHCQPSKNFDRNTKLDLTTEPPLLGSCCYGAFLF
jgi:hypothetical protein